MSSEQIGQKLTSPPTTWYHNNKDKAHAKWREWNMTPEGRACNLVRGARRRTRDRETRKLSGSEEQVLLAYVAERLRVGMCEATGLRFSFNPPPAGSRFHPRAPSLDRVDPSKGYELGNVWLVTASYNFGRHQLSVAEFDELVLARAAVLAKQRKGTP